MMTMRLAGLLTACALLLASSAAAHLDSEGPDSSGLNDTSATAQPIPAPTSTSSATVYGWIDSANENDVDFYRFTLDAPSAIYIDIDFAEDAGTDADEDVGLDPAVCVFDASGSLIATNDDSDFFQTGPGFNAGTDPGSDAYADHDPFIGELPLDAGSYYVAIAWWDNDANASLQPGLAFSPLSESGSEVTGATPDASFRLTAACASPVEQCVGPYQIQIRSDFMGVVDAEGSDSSGQNDDAGTAQLLGDLQPGGSLTTFGWIDQNNVNDVDFWRFSLSASAGVHFDMDFAEDIRTDDDADVGLDPELWVFDADGRLIANNDDADNFEIGPFNEGYDPGSDPYGDHDPMIGELVLDPGDYTVAVAYWANNANAISQAGLSFTSLSDSGDQVLGATPDTSFAVDRSCDDPVGEQCVGAYQLQVRTLFVPEPGALAGQFTAVLLLGALARARRHRPSPARRAVCSP